jgi:hypothetical protein
LSECLIFLWDFLPKDFPTVGTLTSNCQCFAESWSRNFKFIFLFLFLFSQFWSEQSQSSIWIWRKFETKNGLGPKKTPSFHFWFPSFFLVTFTFLYLITLYFTFRSVNVLNFRWGLHVTKTPFAYFWLEEFQKISADTFSTNVESGRTNNSPFFLF